MWSYAISNNLLNRKFSIKWWDSLKIDPIINQLNKDFPPLVHRAIAQKTRSQSSLEFVSVAKKSSKELEDLADQLLLQAFGLEEEEKTSLASSEASTSYHPFDPFQDSQDPYECHNLDSPQIILVAPITTQNSSKQLQIRSLFKTVQVTIHKQYQLTQKDKNEQHTTFEGLVYFRWKRFSRKGKANYPPPLRISGIFKALSRGS